MPGQYIPREDSLGSAMANLHRQIEAAVTSPVAGNQTIQNGAQVVLGPSGNAETLHGRYVWPTTPWVGNVVYGLVVFDGSGHPVTVTGLQPDGLYGVGIYNAAGERQVLLGKQPTTGVYGLSVINNAGVLQQVGGAVYDFEFSGVSGWTSSSYTNSGAVLGARIGSSGQALVTFGLAMAVRALYGKAAVFVDNVLQSQTVIQGSSPTSGALVQPAGTFLISGLSPGLRSFDVRVATGPAGGGGNDADFFSIALTVQPY